MTKQSVIRFVAVVAAVCAGIAGYNFWVQKQIAAQVSEMQKAVEMNNDLFQAGKATYLEIITAQQSLLSAQLNEVSDTFQRMQAVINLYSALGGGRE